MAYEDGMGVQPFSSVISNPGASDVSASESAGHWQAAMQDAGLNQDGILAPPDAAGGKPDRSLLQKTGDFLTDPHTTLGAASFAPSLFGAAASAADGLLYAAQGKYGDAGLSLGAAVVGTVSDAGAVRLAAKGAKAGVEALAAAHAGEAVAHAVEAERTVQAGGAVAHASETGVEAEKAAQATGTTQEVSKVAGPEVQDIVLSRSRFGHTFERHGQDATEFLTNRAKAMGQPNGQFLDDQAAARFIQDNISKVKGGPVSLALPKDFPARIINPDGSFAPARTIRLVPGGKGVKTAFPEP